MAHFRGTLPLSPGPDISKETTPQPQSCIKPSHLHKTQSNAYESGVRLIRFFSLVLPSREGTDSRTRWWQVKLPKQAEFPH